MHYSFVVPVKPKKNIWKAVDSRSLYSMLAVVTRPDTLEIPSSTEVKPVIVSKPVPNVSIPDISNQKDISNYIGKISALKPAEKVWKPPPDHVFPNT